MMLGSRVLIVDKCGVWTDENVVLDLDAIPQIHTTLNRYPITEFHVVLDEAVSIDIAVTADFCSWQYDSILPDSGACPNLL
jgi:hypothetical protein